MRRGTKHLRIASVIQIVLGAVSAAAIYLMIGTEGAAAGVDPQAALARCCCPTRGRRCG